MAKQAFVRGMLVRIKQGPFHGYLGIVLDPDTDTDQRGNNLPKPSPGYHWVMIKISGGQFVAHMFDDELEVAR